MSSMASARRARRWCSVAGLAACAWLATAAVAGAATVAVTTTSDGDDGACTAANCTLREAIAYSAGDDVVTVPSSSNHYVLQPYGEIVVNHPVTVQGAGTGETIVDAQGRSRAFEITTSGTVTFQGVTITRGSVTGDVGGCIHGDPGSGAIVLTDVAVTNCSVTATARPNGHNGGGAIYAEGGALTITGSTLSGNSVIASSNTTGFNGGGAIFFSPSPKATLTITDSVLSGNSAVTNDNPGGVNGGGALLNETGKVELLRTTLRGNSVTANGNDVKGIGNDGGGAILDDSGPTTLTESTVTNNMAYVAGQNLGGNGGGGILAQAGDLTLVASTVADNTATVVSSGDEEGGGGISATNRSVTIVSSTISGNAANLANATGPRSGGGGVMDYAREPSTYINSTIANNRTNVPLGEANGGGGVNIGSDGTFTNMTIVRNAASAADGGGLLANYGDVTIMSSIIIGNSAQADEDCAGRSGMESFGYNLMDPWCSEHDENTDLGYRKPRLGALRNNGGPTKTIALLRGSPAIDAIPLSACTDQATPAQRLTADQRGFSRPDRTGRGCDIGAFESSAPRPPVKRARPRITGVADPGRTLTAHRGRWANGPTAYFHQWLRCNAHGRRCREIPDATGMHYRVSRADVGHRLRVRERATNGVGRGTESTSGATRVVGRHRASGSPSNDQIVGELRR